MDGVKYHKELAASGRWAAMSLPKQLANIGSEVSRSIRWREKGDQQKSEEAFWRCLELMDMTIEAAHSPARREILRLREVLCDYFAGDNEYQTTPEWLMKYFDSFACLP